jgi:hypothetical protein
MAVTLWIKVIMGRAVLIKARRAKSPLASLVERIPFQSYEGSAKRRWMIVAPLCFREWVIGAPFLDGAAFTC